MAPSATTNIPDGDTWIRANPEYEIPNITLNNPYNRKVKVITIGGGMSGIMMAYKIQKFMHNIDHVVYEKNPEVGGTWFENRYPGCACDVPSHAYTFPWAPNPDWPRFLSSSADILVYAQRMVDSFDLRKYMHFNHQVSGCFWDDKRGKWRVTIDVVEPKSDWSSNEPLKVLSSFEDECDMIVHATGILNRWDYPKIPGLDKFKGRIVHTAGWPDNYGEEEWKKEESVVVIGSGASSVQTVPTMAPFLKHMDVFVRTPVWFVQIVDNFGNNHEYSEEEKDVFRKDSDKLLAHVASVEYQMNGRFFHSIMGHPQQIAAKEAVTARMREMIKDDVLYKGITPDFPVNCRRPTPGDPYLKAIQQDNVDVHFTAVASITPDGVIGSDGVERKASAIVCATGFDVSYRPRFPVVGKNGVDLRNKWKDAPEGYMGMMCADMPNWCTVIGPTWPVVQGSIMGALDANGDYALQLIRKLQNEMVKSFTPSQKAQDEFNEHTQTWAQLTIWTESCRSWYKNNDTGRLNAVWPGHSLHFREMCQNVRWEDFDVEYQNKNRFAFMGYGSVMQHIPEGAKLGYTNYSPYTTRDRLDERFFPYTKPKNDQGETTAESGIEVSSNTAALPAAAVDGH